ncbi:MAG: TCR/Tet family MFS transporter [Pseudomonadota bacterium]
MKRNLPILFILSTLVLDAMGIGLILPVMPDLIADVRGADLSQAAVWGGIMATSFAIMQFFFSPAVGNLSDRFGRRTILLISLAVIAVDYVVMALAQTIWLLLLGRIVAGLAAATYATATAFIADISPPEQRAQNFGLIAASFGIGFVLGPAAGGLLGEIGPRAPFVAAAALATINLAIGLLFITESLPKEKRRPFDPARANPFGSFKYIGNLPGARRFLTVIFLYDLATYVYPAIWAYFTAAAFGWDTGIIGASLAVYGISLAIVQGGLIRVILAYLGERAACFWGMALNVICLTLYGLADQSWMIWVLIPFSAIGSVVAPAMTAMLSRAASDDQQGELQGLLGSMKALTMIMSPLIMTQAFFWFTRDGAAIVLPGAPFLVAAVLMGIGFAVLVSRPGAPQAT